MTAPSDAPADTPSRPGSASGLRVRPCSTAPHRPSVAPTAIARTVRGSLSSVTISDARVALDDNRPFHISAGLIQTRPASRDTTEIAARVSMRRPFTNPSCARQPIARFASDAFVVGKVFVVSLNAGPRLRHNLEHHFTEVAGGNGRGLG